MRQHRLLRLISLCLLLSLLCALLPLAPAHAREADEGYRITSYHVDVTAGTDRAYTVTETITMEMCIRDRGDPIELYLRGYELTIRGEDAAKITIEETR